MDIFSLALAWIKSLKPLQILGMISFVGALYALAEHHYATVAETRDLRLNTNLLLQAMPPDQRQKYHDAFRDIQIRNLSTPPQGS